MTERLSTDTDWLVELADCPSTNSWMLERLDRLDHGQAVWTRQQTAGRGQAGRRWVAPPGSLTVSYALHLPLGPANQILGLLAGLATALAIEDAAPGFRIHLKWPNDLYLDGAKLGGLLCEARIAGDRHSIVVGIGLNVRNDWQAAGVDPRSIDGIRAISLQDAGVGIANEQSLIAPIRTYLLQAAAMLVDGRWGELLTDLRSRDCLHGRSVIVEHAGTRLHGQAAGIDDDGNLLLVEAATGLQSISAGHVTILPSAAVTDDQA